jgi:hypothetical protein
MAEAESRIERPSKVFSAESRHTAKRTTPAVSTGLTAFFDILGYREMLLNNEPEALLTVIADVFHKIPSEANFERIELSPYGLNPEFLVFSDSILVYRSLDEAGLTSQYAHRFIEFCSQLTGRLLSAGLPVRGAICKGRFSIIGGKSFAGSCIVEAYEWAQRLEVAGCVILPSFESELWQDERSREELVLWETPLKGSPPQKLLLLNYSRFLEGSKPISRVALIECFAGFKKGVNPQVLPKINNTLRFLEECKPRGTRQPE